MHLGMSGEHPGGIWEACGKQLEGIWGSGQADGALEAKPTKSNKFFTRERPNPHDLRSLRAKVGGRLAGAKYRDLYSFLTQVNRQNLYRRLCLGNIILQIIGEEKC